VLFSNLDTVCAEHLTDTGRARVTGTGAYLDVAASASAKYSGLPGSLSAQLEGRAFGRFVRSGGEEYIDADLSGTFKATGQSWLLPGVEGSGTITARVGRFTTPGGGSQLGIKGTLEATIKAQSGSGENALSIKRAVFIDQNGRYTDENVDHFSPAEPAAASRRRHPRAAHSQAAGGRYPFRLARGQTQTTIVVEAADGAPSLELTTPGGQRALIEPPGTIRPVGRVPRDALANVYAVHTAIPHTVIAYLPDAEPGRWVARVRGVPDGSYRLDITGNQPRPRLRVTQPARRHPATLTLGRRPVTIRGSLIDGSARATVSLYAGRGPCGARGGAQPVARGVRVRRGAWRFRWTPPVLRPGQYAIYAELDNGRGPLVASCAERVVLVRARRPQTMAARRHPAPALATRRPVVREAPLASTAAAKQCVAVVGNKPDEVPVFHVYEAGPDSTPDIAWNDYNAIKNKDQKAELHWGLYNRPACKSVSRQNRQKACGQRQHMPGKQPGPGEPDTAPGLPTRKGPKNRKTSCDEYPFASTIEGGSSATTAGVLGEENSKQGGLYSAFLRKNANTLAHLGGRFRVCAHLADGRTAGKCTSGP
jgi:Deoxyribonuclease NucA/NucB